MTHVVISGYDEARIHERDYHVKIAPRVLAKSVYQLDDAHWLAGWYVNPALHFIALVVRGETDFM